MASDGQPTLWSCLVNLHVNSCGGYQQLCVDTGKLGVAQGFEAQMTASNIVFPRWIGTLPCIQAIHMGVACLNAQSGASEQGDDLEHTGHTSFSHSQRQPAHLTSASAQAWGTSSASSLRMQLQCSSTRGCMQRQTSGPALGLIGWPQAVCVLGDRIVFLSAWWMAESCQWQAKATYLVTLSVFYHSLDW